MSQDFFFEKFPNRTDVKIGFEVSERLCLMQTEFQKLECVDSPCFGRALLLDDVIQTTYRDEFIYHEMISHVPMCSHPNPKTVLIIGGGDGGVMREVVKHKTLEKVTLVELDSLVVENTKKYMPQIPNGVFEHEKVEIVYADGAEFIKGKTEMYDIVIVDSPDPTGPAVVLFQDEFYVHLKKSLKKGGIMVRQSGSTFLQPNEIKQHYRKLKGVFQHVDVYLCAIPTYIVGFFSIMYGSNDIDPRNLTRESVAENARRIDGKTKYYNPDMHFATFAWPNYVRDLIHEAMEKQA